MALLSAWQVAAGDTTAINGKWIREPGNIFFDELMKEFPDMPFVAEDLDLIDPELELSRSLVRKLRTFIKIYGRA